MSLGVHRFRAMCFSARGVEVLGHDNGEERSECRCRDAIRRIEDGRSLDHPSATGAPRPAVHQPATDFGAHRAPAPPPSPGATTAATATVTPPACAAA